MDHRRSWKAAVALGLALLTNRLVEAAPKVEEGSINGAAFRIDVPENWNGGLVMFCHGYAGKPGVPRVDRFSQAFIEKGFAVAQSGYAGGGWAVEEAMIDTEALRRYFIAKYGKAKPVIVSGASMGGHLTVALLEQHPDAYDAGLSLCGQVAPAHWFMQRRVFDLRVVFDFYFPGVYAPLDKLDSPHQETKEEIAKVVAALGGNVQAAAALRKISGLRTDGEVASVIGFYTSILHELFQRAGGNAFDNRGTLYEGSSDDNALNDGVKRYAGDAKARLYLQQHASTTGRLKRPLLAIQTTYDPLIPAWATNQYGSLVEQEDTGNLFLQHYVKRDGHCAFQPADIGKAFDQLLQWKSSGQRPPAGAL